MSISTLIRRITVGAGLVALVLATGCGNGNNSKAEDKPSIDEAEETDDGCEYSEEKVGAYTYDIMICDTNGDGFNNQITKEDKQHGRTTIEYWEQDAECYKTEVAINSTDGGTNKTTIEYTDCVETKRIYEINGTRTVTTYELDEQNRWISAVTYTDNKKTETIAFGTCPNGELGHIEKTTYSFDKEGTTEKEFRDCGRLPYQTIRPDGELEVHDR